MNSTTMNSTDKSGPPINSPQIDGPEQTALSRVNMFATFNARNIEPEEVALTFIPPDEFKDLVLNQHTLLMGPRGSGKTTMIKMLTPQALRSWSNVPSRSHKPKPTFTAIYVPTDVQWHSQITYAERVLNDLKADFGDIISNALITLSVQRSFINTVEDLIQWELQRDFDDPTVSEMWTRIIQLWSLGKVIPTHSSALDAISSRFIKVSGIVAKAGFEPNSCDREFEANPWLFLDFLPLISGAISIFEDVFHAGKKGKWALCFDELELAPTWLQKLLMQLLRSSNEQLLFKLSTSPIPNLFEDIQAAERHDFKTLLLWPYSGKQHRAFCRELTRVVLEQNNIHPANPRIILGETPLTTDISDDNTNEYSKNSNPNSGYNILRDTAQFDRSLHELLLRNGINPEDPVPVDAKQIEKIHKKAKPTALLRRELRKVDSQGRTMGRSRKSPIMYFGEDAVYSVSDGNPRWLIGILNELKDAIPLDRAGNARPIPVKKQSDALKTISTEFRTLLSVLPGSSVVVEDRRIDLHRVLGEIAKYFFDNLVAAHKFPLDPVGTFKVDSWLPSPVVELLRNALYFGAIIDVEPIAQPHFGSLKGRRFRLSYGLAPAWYLPLRLYRPIALSTCSPTIKGLHDVISHPMADKNQLALAFNEDETSPDLSN